MTDSKDIVKSEGTPAGAMQLGRVLAESGYFEDARQASQAIVKVLAGQELGFGPISSMTGIYIVKGRVTLSANLIAAAIGRSEHYGYSVGELTEERCEITFLRDGEIIGISEFSFEDAKRAGLLHGDNWVKYPRNMLFARALTNGAKWYCPDVMNGELPIQTMEDAGLPEPVEAIEGVVEAEAERPETALPAPARVSAPPEGFEPNWTGFWGEMRRLLGEGCRTQVHAFFDVSDDGGALKDYAERRSGTQGKPLTEVIADMRQEVADAQAGPESEVDEDKDA